MENSSFAYRRKDWLFLIGIACLVLALGFFTLPFFAALLPDSQPGSFIPNFLITILFFVLLVINGRLRKGRDGLIPMLQFLLLFLISAWALNREMSVFAQPVTWFIVLQVLFSVNFIAFAFINDLPQWLRLVMVVILGIATIVLVYMNCFLLNLFPYSVVGVFVMGISVHTFVPLLLLIYTLVLMKKVAASFGRKFLWGFGGGAVAVIVFTIFFMVQWALTRDRVDNAWENANAARQDGLPSWMAVAMQVPLDPLVEKMLMTDVAFISDGPNADRIGFLNPFNGIQEGRFHDPLVILSVFFAGKPNIEKADKVRILNSIFGQRHQNTERLWSDENLVTDHVNTSIRVWPQYRIAYTEQTITVANRPKEQRSWASPEEAVYTFHMPEGSVVTSLSLWVNGKEEKGRLTTKGKADSAYREIVGVERRDPSVVHWQEGNTITVRVFPVVNKESRMFKLGITSPLVHYSDRLYYDNIYFEGPSYQDALETIQFSLQQTLQDSILPERFSPSGYNILYKPGGTYTSRWLIDIKDQPLSREPFCFDKKCYTVHPYFPEFKSTPIKTIYLDVNAAWSKAEFDTACSVAAATPVFVFTDKLIQVNQSNREELFESLQQKRFSLFPIFLIQKPGEALLITKSDPQSPSITDLQSSQFYESLVNYLKDRPKIKLFNIDRRSSTYLKSLKEFRVFQYDEGSMERLKHIITYHEFPAYSETEREIVIEQAGIKLVETEGTVTGTGPDHLLRLFTYNHIMQQTGVSILTGHQVDSTLMAAASKAFVVTPVSSLVVLETQKDYDRFNIDESKNSLKNASESSKGAVPEPHEWALILLAILVLCAAKFRPILNKRSLP